VKEEDSRISVLQTIEISRIQFLERTDQTIPKIRDQKGKLIPCGVHFATAFLSNTDLLPDQVKQWLKNDCVLVFEGTVMQTPDGKIGYPTIEKTWSGYTPMVYAVEDTVGGGFLSAVITCF
jgi:hypothetical protein